MNEIKKGWPVQRKCEGVFLCKCERYQNHALVIRSPKQAYIAGLKINVEEIPGEGSKTGKICRLEWEDIDGLQERLISREIEGWEPRKGGSEIVCIVLRV